MKFKTSKDYLKKKNWPTLVTMHIMHFQKVISSARSILIWCLWSCYLFIVSLSLANKIVINDKVVCTISTMPYSPKLLSSLIFWILRLCTHQTLFKLFNALKWCNARLRWHHNFTWFMWCDTLIRQSGLGS